MRDVSQMKDFRNQLEIGYFFEERLENCCLFEEHKITSKWIGGSVLPFLGHMSPHHLFETASVACFFGSSNHGWLVVWDHEGFGLVKNSWKKSF